jgi:hypothetical protein
MGYASEVERISRYQRVWDPRRMKKNDFAIIDKNTEEPKVLIEFKAISILTQLKSKQALKRMENDFRKMKLFQFKKGAKPELYFVQLVNIPKKKLEKWYNL